MVSKIMPVAEEFETIENPESGSKEIHFFFERLGVREFELLHETLVKIEM